MFPIDTKFPAESNHRPTCVALEHHGAAEGFKRTFTNSDRKIFSRNVLEVSDCFRRVSRRERLGKPSKNKRFWSRTARKSSPPLRGFRAAPRTRQHSALQTRTSRRLSRARLFQVILARRFLATDAQMFTGDIALVNVVQHASSVVEAHTFRITPDRVRELFTL